MNYDKTSFLAGLAVGRQLKGWNLFPQPAAFPGWTADPAYLWRGPGLLGYIPAASEQTLEGLGIHGGYGTVSGNRATTTGQLSRFSASYYDHGDIVLWDLTVDALTYPMSAIYPGVNVAIPGTGVWVATTTTAPGAVCSELGRGTLRFDRKTDVAFYHVLNSGTGAFTVNGIYVNDRCIVPGGNAFYKKRSGMCIGCFVRYRKTGGAYVSTPVLISDLLQATEWTFKPDGISQTEHTGQYLYHGISWYMSTAGEIMSSLPESDTGAAILDLTGGSAISSEQDLFLAVANAAGLAVI